MKKIVACGILFAMASYINAQSSTTDTNCDMNGQTANCTSTTAPAPQAGGFWAGFAKAQGERQIAAKATQEHDANAKAYADAQAIAFKNSLDQFANQQKAEQENKETVNFLYCRENPNATVFTVNGILSSCTDVLQYTKAYCLVNTEAERCTLAKSRAEVEKAFKNLAATYNADPKRGKKSQQDYYNVWYTRLIRWACMSFPDMVVPQCDGSQYFCPAAAVTSAAR